MDDSTYISVQYDDTRSTTFHSPQHRQPLHAVKSEGHITRRPHYPPLYTLLDTALQESNVPDVHPTQIAQSRGEDQYPNAQHHTSSPTVAETPYDHVFPYQYHLTVQPPNAVENNWQQVVPSSQPPAPEAPNTSVSSLTSSSAPSSATSIHPSTAPWLPQPPSPPTVPTPTSERSSSSPHSLTFIAYQHPGGGAPSGGDRGPVVASKPENNKPRPPPSAYQNPQVSAASQTQPAAATSAAVNDQIPRRGRRPVRKSASEQHLHDQQRQHQHQLHLQNPPRSTRQKYRPSNPAPAHEIGPVRGVGAAREETSRRKSSIASASSSKGDSDSPLLKGASYQMVWESVSVNVRSPDCN